MIPALQVLALSAAAQQQPTPAQQQEVTLCPAIKGALVFATPPPGHGGHAAPLALAGQPGKCLVIEKGGCAGRGCIVAGSCAGAPAWKTAPAPGGHGELVQTAQGVCLDFNGELMRLQAYDCLKTTSLNQHWAVNASKGSSGVVLSSLCTASWCNLHGGDGFVCLAQHSPSPAPPAPARPKCVVPVAAWHEPIFHVMPKQLNSTHCADAASVIFLDGVWHWWLGCQGGWHHLISQGGGALVDWTLADPLVVNGQGGDTGSVTVTPSGIYLFLPGCGGLCRRVALDRSMTRWSNATLAKGTEHHPSNFRDPSRPFLHQDNRWYIVAGSGLTYGEQFGNMTGPLAFGMMFVADDDTLASWQFASFIHVGNQTRNGVSIDTFECPDVWPLPDARVVFEASMCSDTCEPPHCAPKPGPKPYPVGSWNNHGEEYWIGSLDPTSKVLTNISEHSAVDYGEYYASKTAAGTDMLGRRVLFGFLEASVNRQGNGTARWSTSCGEKLVEPEALPRDVALRPDGNLGFEPVVELQALRLAASELRKTATLKCGDELPIGDLGHSLEIRASFTTSGTAAATGHSFGVSVLASASGDEATAIGVSADHFYVDKTRSTMLNAAPPVFKDLMTAPLGSSSTSATTNLTVFVDGRVVETFVKGRALSTLVYPSKNASTRLRLFMRCADDDSGVGVVASVRAWALRAITVSSAKPPEDAG